jgi:hypothetical protein
LKTTIIKNGVPTQVPNYATVCNRVPLPYGLIHHLIRCKPSSSVPFLHSWSLSRSLGPSKSRPCTWTYNAHLPLEITAHISRTTRLLSRKEVEEMMLWQTTHHIRHIAMSTRKAALRLLRRLHLCVNDCSIYSPQLYSNMSILMNELAMPLT